MKAGVHVCEGCGAVYDTIGPYLSCRESHPGISWATCAICGEACEAEPAGRPSYCSIRCYLRGDEHARRNAAFVMQVKAAMSTTGEPQP